MLSRSDAPQKACPDPCIGESAGAAASRREYDALQGRALAATILVPAGAVATAAGIWLWITSGSSKQSARGAFVYVTGTHAGLRGAF